jgi:hypothetical protein
MLGDNLRRVDNLSIRFFASAPDPKPKDEKLYYLRTVHLTALAKIELLGQSMRGELDLKKLAHGHCSIRGSARIKQ